MHLIQTVAPTIEPLTLSDAKLHCRVDITADDSLITSLITAARIWVEQYCINSLITQTWSVTYDINDNSLGKWFLKRHIRIPQTPVQSVTAITTYDAMNNATVFDPASYRLSGDKIVLNDNYEWPLNLRLYDSIKIDFIAGFGSLASNVPPGIILAMKMLVAEWYEKREAINDDYIDKGGGNQQSYPIPFGVTALLQTYRVPVL